MSGFAQSSNDWKCDGELPKAIKVGPEVAQVFIEQEALPNVSDLKDRKLKDVKLDVIVGTEGKVVCTRMLSGDGDDVVVARTLDAIKLWHFRQYLLNGKPVPVQVGIVFRLQKNGSTAELSRTQK